MFMVFMFWQKLKVGYKVAYAIWLQPCKRKVGKILEGNIPKC